MTITGSIKFDALALVSLEANLPEKSMRVRAAFIDTKTGETHGFTDGHGHIWSPETKAALTTLATLIEKDLGRLHLVNARTPGAAKAPVDQGGLGEHVGSDTTPST